VLATYNIKVSNILYRRLLSMDSFRFSKTFTTHQAVRRQPECDVCILGWTPNTPCPHGILRVSSVIRNSVPLQLKKDEGHLKTQYSLAQGIVSQLSWILSLLRIHSTMESAVSQLSCILSPLDTIKSAVCLNSLAYSVSCAFIVLSSLKYVSTLLDTQSLGYSVSWMQWNRLGYSVSCMQWNRLGYSVSWMQWNRLLYVSSIHEKSSLFTLPLSWILGTCGRMLMQKKEAQTHGAAATPSLCTVSSFICACLVFHISYVPLSSLVFS